MAHLHPSLFAPSHNAEGFGKDWDGRFGPDISQWRKMKIYTTPLFYNKERFEREIVSTATKNKDQPRSAQSLLLKSYVIRFSDLEKRYDRKVVDDMRWWLNKMANKGFVRIS